MKIPREHQGRFFYHFTHIDNLDSIIEKGLLSTNLKREYEVGHFDVANASIQHRRSEMQVDVGPGGTVHDYVPFYFSSTSMMLLGLINNKIIDQREIIFLAVSIEKLLESDVIFTDASANTVIPPNFYDDPEELRRLDWNLIDNPRWKKGTSEELHARMAEVLIYNKVPIDWIDAIVVFDAEIEAKVKSSFYKNKLKALPIFHKWFNNRFFYFTKFMFEGRKEESLVTGPKELLERYTQLVENIIDEQACEGYGKAKFDDIEDALKQIEENFCVLPELQGIYDLETDNSVHQQTVSEHTLSVVRNVEKNKYYQVLGQENQQIVRLAAYLHDIGKGPKSKWSNGIQKAYEDHPRDAIQMLYRILTRDFCEISEEEVKKICLLVVYHDLFGDILKKGRRVSELNALRLNNTELTMLAAISKADVESISQEWSAELEDGLDILMSEVKR